MVSRYRSGLAISLIFTHLATLLVTNLGPALPEAVADTTTVPAVSTGSTYSPFNFTGSPVSFQVAQAQSFSNLYGSCFSFDKNQTDPLVSSIVQLTVGKDKGLDSDLNSCASVKADSCSTSLASPRVSCPLNKDEAAINKIFKTALGQAHSTDCCIQAKMGQLQEASKELSCINQQNDLLANQIKSMQADLQTKFQQAQKDLAQIDGVLTDRVQQKEFIQSKLGEDKDSGNGGLLKLQADMQKLITGDLPTQIKGFQDGIKAYNDKRASFQQLVDNQKIALTKQCFLSADSRYQCTVNSSGTCSFAELIEAKYYELSRSVNGQIQRNNKANQAQAQSKKAALDALFQEIFSNMSSDINLTVTSDQEAQARQLKAGNINGISSPSDLETLYGARLASFDIPGLDVQQLFENKFGQCYNQANAAVEKSKSDPNSQYSQQVKLAQQEEKNIRDGFIKFYKGSADVYARFWSTMGQTAPLNTDACSASSVPLAGMMKCAEDLETNLDGAYYGNTPNSAVSILVKGNSTNPVTQFSFNCNGVNGCVTVMQNLVTNLKSETQKLDQSKKSYIQQANQTLEQYKMQMQQVLSVQNQALMGRLSTLKGVLARNGVNDPLSTDPVKKVPMVKSKYTDSTGKELDGLYEMPSDLLGVIGGDLSPPMIDPSSSTFDNARQSIAQAISQNTQKESEAARIMAEISNSQQSCLSRFNQALAKKGLGYLDDYGRNCVPSVCLDEPDTQLDALSKALFDVVPAGNDLRDDIKSKLSGYADQCDTIDKNRTEAFGKLNVACASLSYCKDSEILADIKASCNIQDARLKKSIEPYTPLADSETKNSACGSARNQVTSAFSEYNKAISAKKTTVSCEGLTNKATSTFKKVGDTQSDSSESKSEDAN